MVDPLVLSSPCVLLCHAPKLCRVSHGFLCTTYTPKEGSLPGRCVVGGRQKVNATVGQAKNQKEKQEQQEARNTTHAWN